MKHAEALLIVLSGADALAAFAPIHCPGKAGPERTISSASACFIATSSSNLSASEKSAGDALLSSRDIELPSYKSFFSFVKRIAMSSGESCYYGLHSDNLPN